MSRKSKKTVKQNAPGAKIANEFEKSIIPNLEMRDEAAHMIRNGLTEAVLGFNPNMYGGSQLSQVDTLFKNNRWYLISNMRNLLSEIYVEHGIIQTVVDVPVDDALRGGVEIKSKVLSPEEIEDLQIELERQDIVSAVVGQKEKWKRLYGGAGILIITDQDPEKPFDIDKIGRDSPLEFRAVDMWELLGNETEPMKHNVQTKPADRDFLMYYSQRVHRSRVMESKGILAPSFIRPRLRGWGLSIVETLIRSVNQYLKANDLTFEVLDEFKVDIFKIKNLANTLLSDDGTAAIQKRVQLANQQKNYQHAITMDAEDDYIQKELSFTGLADTMVGIRMQIASDLRMPLTKVFGISAAGFSSGEDDIENYNSMVESTVRAKCKFEILRIIEILSQKMFGYVPDDLSIDFRPLRVLSSEQEETVKTQKFNRLLAAKTAGEMSSKEFKDACNKEKLLSIQVDTSSETLDEGDSESGEENGDEAQESPGGADGVKAIPATAGREGKKSVTAPKEAKT